jgi:ABC-2 type transport system permease protein
MFGRIITLTSVELYKLTRQKFSYLLLAFVVVNAVLVGLGSRIFPAIISAMGGGGGGASYDGYTFASVIATGTFSSVGAGTISILAFSGSMVASEVDSGTIKNLLTRPLYRSELIIAKAIALLVYCGVVVLVTAIIGVLSGAYLYGMGDISIAETGEVYRTQGEMLMNLGVSYAMDLVSLYTVACLGLLISVLVNNNGWAVITALLLYFPIMFLKNFDLFSGWIFTAYMDMGQNVLREMVVVKSKTWTPEIYRFAGVNILTMLTLLASTVAAFGRKEIN